MRCNLFSSLKICIALTSLWRPAGILFWKKAKRKLFPSTVAFYMHACVFIQSSPSSQPQEKRAERKTAARIYLFLFVWRSEECTRGAIGNFRSALFPIVQKSAPRSNRWFACMVGRCFVAARTQLQADISPDIHRLIISAAPISQLIVPKKSVQSCTTGAQVRVIYLSTRMQLSTKGQFAFSRCNRTLWWPVRHDG